MSKARVPRIPDPPCEHYDQQEGTISAGNLHGPGPFCGVATCRDCINKSAGYVTLRTGIVADPFLSYEDSRKQRAEESA